MKTEKNQYKIGKEMIDKQKMLEIKALKTFKGMEGMGVNCNMYLDGKKIGEIIDEGNGGCLHITYFNALNQSQKERDNWNEVRETTIDRFLSDLPTYTNKEMGWDFNEDQVNKWDEESLWNHLITMAIAKRDFKKDMKKIQVIDADGKLCYYKAFTSRDLHKPYKNKAGEIVPLQKLLKEDHGCKKILNLLPESESFDIWFGIVYSGWKKY